MLAASPSEIERSAAAKQHCQPNACNGRPRRSQRRPSDARPVLDPLWWHSVRFRCHIQGLCREHIPCCQTTTDRQTLASVNCKQSAQRSPQRPNQLSQSFQHTPRMHGVAHKKTHTFVVRPKNLSGFCASIAMGSSALRLVTSRAVLISSAEASGGTFTPSVAVTFTYNTRLDTCLKKKNNHVRQFATTASQQAAKHLTRSVKLFCAIPS